MMGPVRYLSHQDLSAVGLSRLDKDSGNHKHTLTLTLKIRILASLSFSYETSIGDAWILIESINAFLRAS